MVFSRIYIYAHEKVLPVKSKIKYKFVNLQIVFIKLQNKEQVKWIMEPVRGHSG